MILAALLGLVFGVLGSIPVAGPISALVVSRGIEGRFKAGVYIALGGAIGEAIYAFLAFWGFSTFLVEYPIVRPISRGVAAVILIVLGVHFLRGKLVLSQDATAPARDSALGSFALGASICLLNPTLIATWAGVVTMLFGSNLVALEGAKAIPFAAGVLVGIVGWYGIALWIIHRSRSRISPRGLTRFIRIIGGVLCAVAIWFGFKLVQDVAELQAADAHSVPSPPTSVPSNTPP